MSGLTDQQVEYIARRAIERLGAVVPARADSPPEGDAGQRASRPADLVEGVFADVDSAVQAAAAAQRELMELSLAKRGRMIDSIRKEMGDNYEALARMAHQETGLGRVEDKIVKNRVVTEKTPGTEDLVPQARSGDRGLVLTEPAPFGVIGAITPITNPTSTIICNTIGMVAAGNGVVFNVHPGAKRVSIHNVNLINRAITRVGGPSNLVTTIAEPTIESAQALMKHAGIGLVVVTGGPGVVKVALQSGKRAICAGPGNPPVVVDETADLDQAGRDVVYGASFDNNVVCVDEKTLIAVNSIADELLRAMKRHGAVVLTPVQARQLEREIFAENRGPGKPGVIKKELIGKNVEVILARIGLKVDAAVRLAVMEVPADHPLVWTEQLTPVLPMVRVKNAEEGIDLAVRSERGMRHTAVMHSKNLDHLSRMARVMNCSIFAKNGPAVAGLGAGGEGHASFTIASPTGEGLTRARDFARSRRCTLVDHFRIV
jgi:acyl-CoA reductase-like NAD-dependent aldehyde dehydrogenase